MRVNYGPLINYASGTFGIFVAAGIRGKKILRRKARPYRPRTAKQIEVALYGARANDIWHRLSNIERISSDSFLFNFHSAWRNITRHKKSVPSSEFLAHYVKSAETAESATDIQVFPPSSRYRNFSSLGVSRTTDTTLTVTAQAPVNLPPHVNNARMLFYYTDFYQFDLEGRIHAGSYNYYLSDTVTDNELLTHQITIPVSPPATERSIIFGAAMYYFLGIRGLFGVSGTTQYNFVMGG